MKIGEISSIPQATLSTQTENSEASLFSRREATDRREVLAAIKELALPELTLPNRGISISYDRETRQSIVRIVDTDSGEILHQIPGKDAVERARYYRQISGL
ncbi:MAG: flagellar protein FlaG [Bryobacter sp.]|jgi:uncharacterized FlaG/YvyC family protein|nr:flagellar protein FlaG [Bryobacter sp. CoA8 C33]